MRSAVTISSLSAENFLSFRRLNVGLGALNVLVGPNGAGKTNVLNIFKFLGEVARRDLIPTISEFGGFDNLAFRGLGTSETTKSPVLRIGLKGFITAHASEAAPDEYDLSFWRRSTPGLHVPPIIHRNEQIVLKRTQGAGRRITLRGQTMRFEGTGSNRRKGTEASSELAVQATSTGLATIRRLGESYGASQINQLAEVFEQLRLFEIDVERVRRPSLFSGSNTLQADGANLAYFLHYLSLEHEHAFNSICEDVRTILPSFQKFTFTMLGGSDESVRVDVVERRLSGATPLARTSFGTIRSVALLAMLHDPDPPRLTCLEEIDHGLHPYALDLLVERLRDASQRSQFILATHSPALVNRLQTEELIIVEKDRASGASIAFKPNENLINSLKQETGYELGELWFSGAIGGTQ